METVKNADQYLSFMQTSNRLSFFADLKSFLINRHYNQPFGDIVHNVIANALNVSLSIYNVTSNRKYNPISVCPWSNTSTLVDIQRIGDHYNGMLPDTQHTKYGSKEQ